MRAAIWLLARFGVHDAVIGDICEEQQAGRSRVWVSRQMVVALLLAVMRDVVAHPLRSTATAVLAVVARNLVFRAWVANEPSIDVAVGQALLGMISLSRPAQVIVVSCINTILLAPAWFVLGFIVARLSRGAVLVFVSAALLLLAPNVARQLAHGIMWPVRWIFPVSIIVFAVSIGGFALSTLLGAVCGAGRSHELE
jgi:hypothetical protein